MKPVTRKIWTLYLILLFDACMLAILLWMPPPRVGLHGMPLTVSPILAKVLLTLFFSLVFVLVLRRVLRLQSRKGFLLTGGSDPSKAHEES